MSMTRKHYKELAKILTDLNDNINHPDHGRSFPDSVCKICYFLKEDNPNFNSSKFIEAIYGKYFNNVKDMFRGLV